MRRGDCHAQQRTHCYFAMSSKAAKNVCSVRQHDLKFLSAEKLFGQSTLCKEFRADQIFCSDQCNTEPLIDNGRPVFSSCPTFDPRGHRLIAAPLLSTNAICAGFTIFLSGPTGE